MIILYSLMSPGQDCSIGILLPQGTYDSTSKTYPTYMQVDQVEGGGRCFEAESMYPEGGTPPAIVGHLAMQPRKPCEQKSLDIRAVVS